MIYSTLEVMTGEEDMINRLRIEDNRKEEEGGILSTGDQ